MRHLLPNTVIAKDEKLHTAGLDYTVMSQVKISITTILHKKKAQCRNTIKPNIPLINLPSNDNDTDSQHGHLNERSKIPLIHVYKLRVVS